MSDTTELWKSYGKIHKPQTLSLTLEEIEKCSSKPPNRHERKCKKCNKFKTDDQFCGFRKKTCLRCYEIELEQEKSKRNIPRPITKICNGCSKIKNALEFSKGGTCNTCRRSRIASKKQEKRKEITKERAEISRGQEDELQKICLYDYAPRNRNVKLLGFKDYNDYLTSVMWANVKDRVFREKGSKCICCKKPAMQIHHMRYAEDDLKGHTLTFMVPICRECHKRIEFDGDFKVSLTEANIRLKRFSGLRNI